MPVNANHSNSVPPTNPVESGTEVAATTAVTTTAAKDTSTTGAASGAVSMDTMAMSIVMNQNRTSDFMDQINAGVGSEDKARTAEKKDTDQIEAIKRSSLLAAAKTHAGLITAREDKSKKLAAEGRKFEFLTTTGKEDAGLLPSTNNSGTATQSLLQGDAALTPQSFDGGLAQVSEPFTQQPQSPQQPQQSQQPPVLKRNVDGGLRGAIPKASVTPQVKPLGVTARAVPIAAKTTAKTDNPVTTLNSDEALPELPQDLSQPQPKVAAKGTGKTSDRSPGKTQSEGRSQSTEDTSLPPSALLPAPVRSAATPQIQAGDAIAPIDPNKSNVLRNRALMESRSEQSEAPIEADGEAPVEENNPESKALAKDYDPRSARRTRQLMKDPARGSIDQAMKNIDQQNNDPNLLRAAALAGDKGFDEVLAAQEVEEPQDSHEAISFTDELHDLTNHANSRLTGASGKPRVKQTSSRPAETRSADDAGAIENELTAGEEPAQPVRTKSKGKEYLERTQATASLTHAAQKLSEAAETISFMVDKLPGVFAQAIASMPSAAPAAAAGRPNPNVYNTDDPARYARFNQEKVTANYNQRYAATKPLADGHSSMMSGTGHLRTGEVLPAQKVQSQALAFAPTTVKTDRTNAAELDEWVNANSSKNA